MKKPPLGVMPQWLWKEHRIAALAEAVARHGKYDDSMNEWIAEMKDHSDWLALRTPLPIYSEIKSPAPVTSARVG